MSGSSRIQDDAEDDRRQYENANEGSCIICLGPMIDRTILPACSHDAFCFECLLVWTELSTKCPLCSAAIGPYLIHAVRSKYDYKKHHISPPRSPPSGSQAVARASSQRNRPAAGTRRTSALQSSEEEDREGSTNGAIARRREIYRHDLYVKHVASNKITGFGPPPPPAKIASSPELLNKASAFVRRELRALGWCDSIYSESNHHDVGETSPVAKRRGIDLEFMTSYVVSLIKMIDLKGERGIRLLAEYLDPGVREGEGRMKNAEHLAHELSSFLRSPYKLLDIYDRAIQYDDPPRQATVPAASYNRGREQDAYEPFSPSRGRGRRDSTSAARARSRSRSPYLSPPRKRRRFGWDTYVPTRGRPGSRSPPRRRYSPEGHERGGFTRPMSRARPRSYSRSRSYSPRHTNRSISRSKSVLSDRDEYCDEGKGKGRRVSPSPLRRQYSRSPVRSISPTRSHSSHPWSQRLISPSPLREDEDSRPSSHGPNFQPEPAPAAPVRPVLELKIKGAAAAAKKDSVSTAAADSHPPSVQADLQTPVEFAAAPPMPARRNDEGRDEVMRRIRQTLVQRKAARSAEERVAEDVMEDEVETGAAADNGTKEDARVKLLAKLQAERAQLQSTAREDLEGREKRLKLQAKLRMKLAREKGQVPPAAGDAGGVSTNGAESAAALEQDLRAKLMSRKVVGVD